MLTRTLGTGLDFTTVQQACNFIRDNIASDDIDILVAPGATIGAATDANSINADFVFGGHTVTFKTNPSNLANTATLLGGIYMAAPSDSAGIVRFEELKLGCQQSAGRSDWPIMIDYITSLQTELVNCVVALTYSNANIPLGRTGGSPAIHFCKNCTILISNLASNQVTTLTFNDRFFNCIVVINSSAAVTANGGANSNGNNTFHNYSEAIGVGSGTFANNLDGDPLFAGGTVFVGEGDSVATMLSQNVQLTENSLLALGNADPAYAPSIDIVGNARSGGA